MTLTDNHAEPLLPAREFRDFGECFFESDVQSNLKTQPLFDLDLLHNGE